MNTSPATRHSLTALAGYLGISAVLFGLPLLKDFSHAFIGSRDAGHADATLMIWFLAWWPHALRHGLDPLRTNLLWAPAGTDLTWSTSIPGPSLLAAPLTLAVGPVACYNALCLLAPALAAWTAFLLCRHLTRACWPAFAGGYVFGFSTYELAHLPGHLNLSLIFLVPLCVYLVALHAEEAMPTRVFAPALAAALLFQASMSLEITATMTMFGAIALVMAVAGGSPDVRRRVRRTAAWIGSAYAAAGLCLSPYLYRLFAHGVPSGAAFPLSVYSTDLLNFLIPTPVTFLGHSLAAPIAERLGGNLKENSAYIGLPLCLIIGLFAARHRAAPLGRLLLGLLGVVTLATLGPRLHVAGAAGVPLPWTLIARVPLVDYAYPARFMVYAFLVIAAMLAVWIGDPRTPRWARGTLPCLGVLLLLPNLPSSNWFVAPDRTPFFDDGLYRSSLSPGENVLIIPYAAAGSGMLWQAESDMYFRMPEGYVNPTAPPAFLRWPIVYTFYYGRLLPNSRTQLRRFLAAHGVSAVVVARSPATLPPQLSVVRTGGGEAQDVPIPPPSRGWTDRLFSSLAVEPVPFANVTLYRVGARVPERSPAAETDDAGSRVTIAQFSALVSAADAYLARGGERAEMTPLRAEREGLLPAYWASARPRERGKAVPRYWTANGLWLSPGPGDTVALGIAGPFPSLAPVVARYGPTADQIYFPAPQRWTGQPTAGRGLLLMLFRRPALARLAQE